MSTFGTVNGSTTDEEILDEAQCHISDIMDIEEFSEKELKMIRIAIDLAIHQVEERALRRVEDAIYGRFR